MSGWISVDDKLPEESRFVDVWLKSTQNSTYGARQTDILFRGGKFQHNEKWNCVYVSHWSRIPLRPEP